MSLINREALYEKACDLEAQALSYVGKIANDETKIDEWRIWSAILTERTAFKHDVFDAPDAKPELTGKWIGYNGDNPDWQRTDGSPVFLTCSECGATVINNFAAKWNYCCSCGADMREEQDAEKPV